MTKVQISLVLLAAACCLMVAPTSAMYHIVGGSLGWSVPPNKTFFEEWAKPRVFGVEDHLLFPFSGLHNVMEVSREDYYDCTLENAVKLYPFGPVILNFTQPGEHYYYSTVGTQCEYGQKLHITVVAGEGKSGKIYSTTEALGEISASPSHAPAPAPNSAPSAGPIGGLEMVIVGLVSFVAWQFV
ncbi:hypothetical protein RHSIM_Rhsim07G0084900 [Rhododendron simsii]|uniref:Phytocyanin domain-containing protein n=1 Tax=Rhododendron simsii TaxID=118357 RepID=A0A834LK15_RHOSS|nr:hypothetical protein RHSIM_Rhsim07G0084900 [Rhododendron simsii]